MYRKVDFIPDGSSAPKYHHDETRIVESFLNAVRRAQRVDVKSRRSESHGAGKKFQERLGSECTENNHVPLVCRRRATTRTGDLLITNQLLESTDRRFPVSDIAALGVPL